MLTPSAVSWNVTSADLLGTSTEPVPTCLPAVLRVIFSEVELSALRALLSCSFGSADGEGLGEALPPVASAELFGPQALSASAAVASSAAPSAVPRAVFIEFPPGVRLRAHARRNGSGRVRAPVASGQTVTATFPYDDVVAASAQRRRQFAQALLATVTDDDHCAPLGHIDQCPSAPG